jgi:hypothetical protein
MHFKREKFSGKLQELIIRAESGNADDVDYIMGHLTSDSTFAMTRYVDYALSWVENEKGVSQIEYYLFNGTLIQRNYSCLFFNRRGDFDIVNRAFNQGLIDEIQTFSR